MRKPFLVAAAVAAAAALVVAAPALADQVFHTSHAAVHPVANTPLQSGFVNDIHTTVRQRRALGVPPERCAAEHDVPGRAPALRQSELRRNALHDGPHGRAGDERRRQRQREGHLPPPAEQPAAAGRDRLAVPLGGRPGLRNGLRAGGHRLVGRTSASALKFSGGGGSRTRVRDRDEMGFSKLSLRSVSPGATSQAGDDEPVCLSASPAVGADVPPRGEASF